MCLLNEVCSLVCIEGGPGGFCFGGYNCVTPPTFAKATVDKAGLVGSKNNILYI